MANDHYVPELYLKNFEIPSKRKHVYRYKRGQETRPKAIRSVASKEDYELLINENEHVKKDTVAAMIKRVENDVSPLIQRLINEENPNLSTSEQELLCSFVSYAVNRVPATRNQIINFFKAAQLVKAKLNAEDKGDFYERWKNSGLSPERVEEERLKILEFEKHYELEMGQGADISLVMSFLGAQLAKQFLKNKPIVFLNNKTRKEFVTSDNPVVCLPDETLPPQPGLGVANSIVYLPLSPKKGILFVNQKTTVNTINLKRHEVDELNSWMINGLIIVCFRHRSTKRFMKSFNRVFVLLRALL